jgi:hypothetical protein
MTTASEREPFDLCIIVSRYAARSADVVARVKAEPGSVPEYLMTGQCSRVDGDGEPKEEWKAWLWKKGGEYPPRGQHCEAVTRPSCGDIEALLNKRLRSRGKWWA